MIGYRALFAALTVVAIIVQFIRSAEVPDFDPVNYFSYFTILGNSFAAIVLAYGAYRLLSGNDTASHTYDRLRGANALYMAIIGVVFALLLSGTVTQMDSTIRWVNTVVHYVMPVVVVADWFLVPTQTRLTFRDVLWWMAIPLLYLAYTLIRGPVVDWYPYPFVDAQTLGYGRVIRTCITIAIGTALAGYAIVALANELRSRQWSLGPLSRSASS
ncbi:MAG: Pr6Pr family membrane protein [Dehalococcoidia bacterium]